MENNLPLSLTESEIHEVAWNLINVLTKDTELTKTTRSFILAWILTDDTGKTNTLYDV